MRIIVAGSRGITDRGLIADEMASLETPHCARPTLLTGMARGPDRIAHAIATLRNWTIEEFPADWNHFGKSAGFRRNVQMAERATHLLAFWDGRSRGTLHMIQTAIEHDLRVHVIGTKPS